MYDYNFNYLEKLGKLADELQIAFFDTVPSERTIEDLNRCIIILDYLRKQKLYYKEIPDPIDDAISKENKAFMNSRPQIPIYPLMNNFVAYAWNILREYRENVDIVHAMVDKLYQTALVIYKLRYYEYTKSNPKNEKDKYEQIKSKLEITKRADCS